MNLSVHWLPSLHPVRQTGAVAPAGRPPLTQTLKKLLKDTVTGKRRWRHQQRAANTVLNTGDLVDVLTTTDESAGLEVELQGTRAATEREKLPTLLRDWTVTLTWKKRKPSGEVVEERKILDGKTCYLPAQPVGESESNLIAHLFRAALETVANLFGDLLPSFQALLHQIITRQAECSYSDIKPDPRYGFPTGAKILQIGSGKQDPRLVLSKVGSALQLTLHSQGQVRKFSSQILQNAELRSALEQMILLASKATGRRDMPGNWFAPA